MEYSNSDEYRKLKPYTALVQTQSQNSAIPGSRRLHKSSPPPSILLISFLPSLSLLFAALHAYAYAYADAIAAAGLLLRPPEIAKASSSLLFRLQTMATFEDEEEAQTMDAMNGGEEEAGQRSSMEEEKQRKKKGKRKPLKEAKNLKSTGVCYLSRVPPKMDPLKLRQHLSHFGEILRLYLTPEDPTAHLKRKKAGGFRGQEFSEGWVEFADKHVAKRIANMLNGEQIGGKKRSQFYYDLWNIKYLSKFKWDDLTEEIATKTGVREQKLAMELSAAKKERDFYLSKVEKARGLNAIDERMKKKQKLQQGSGPNTENSAEQHEAPPKVVRLVPQTKPIEDVSRQSKPRLSRDVLAEVFNSG